MVLAVAVMIYLLIYMNILNYIIIHVLFTFYSLIR